jgi:hypothetical protein
LDGLESQLRFDAAHEERHEYQRRNGEKGANPNRRGKLIYFFPQILRAVTLNVVMVRFEAPKLCKNFI